jgi:signal transduction histidine kinase
MDKKDFLRDSYKILEKIYLDKGDYEKAYAYLGEYEKYKSAIINENLTKKITDLEKKFELESYKRELQARQFENEQQELIIGFTVGGIVILLGISVLLVISNRKRRLANNLLEEKNRQIEENKDELEKANNMKDKIFSIIGHDLKNPFTALHGYTDILKDEYEQLGDEEKKEYIAEVSKSSHKIYDLLDNMLNWAAAQTGKLKYELKEVKLKKTVDSVLELSESQAKNKDIQFETDSIDNIKVKADKYMLEVVLRNLVNNAIKFSHQGGTIELASRQNNGQVIVSVKDNGVGMSEEMKQKIFENGSKKSQIGTKGEKGTGLGITLCHDFIKRNHGELWVESAPQKGTTFKFTLEKA